MEEFVYIYNTDISALSEIRNSFFEEGNSEVTEINLETTLEEEVALKELSQEEQTSSGTVVISRIQTSLTPEQISGLDNNFYYNLDGIAFELKIVYTQTDNTMELAALQMQDQLKKV